MTLVCGVLWSRVCLILCEGESMCTSSSNPGSPEQKKRENQEYTLNNHRSTRNSIHTAMDQRFHGDSSRSDRSRPTGAEENMLLLRTDHWKILFYRIAAPIGNFIFKSVNEYMPATLYVTVDLLKHSKSDLLTGRFCSLLSWQSGLCSGYCTWLHYLCSPIHAPSTLG